ncbi:MAG: glycosyltransferase family 1 protein [Patescibacteria group bacterium]
MRLIVDARPFVGPHPGGVSRVSLELVDALAADNPGMEIVCATTGSRQPQLPTRLADRKNVKHVHLKIPNKIWSALSIVGAVSLFEQTEKRCGKADAFFMPNLGFVGRLPKNVPTVLLLHDLSFLIEPSWFKRKQRWWHEAVKAKELIRGVSRLLAVSETTKRDAMRLLGIKEEKISVIPIGSTISVATNPKPTTTPPRYCLALGLGDARKNTATAIEAVELLRKENGFGDLGLVLIGCEIKENVISSLSRNLPIGRSLRFGRDDNFITYLKNPTDTELSSLYANAAAFLYPSWYEGYGLPLHEAASFGVPCIASTSGALPETAPKGTIFANPAKPQQWVEAMKLAFSIPQTPQAPNPAAWRQAAAVLGKSFR